MKYSQCENNGNVRVQFILLSVRDHAVNVNYMSVGVDSLVKVRFLPSTANFLITCRLIQRRALGG